MFSKKRERDETNFNKRELKENECEQLLKKIYKVIEAYNNKAFCDYVYEYNQFLQDDLYGGGNKENPLQDSFVQPFSEVYSSFCSKKTFLVVGSGPNGMMASKLLSSNFPEMQVLILDNRIDKEHYLKPFSRHRILAGLQNKMISEWENELYQEIKNDYKNVFFLFSREWLPSNLVSVCDIDFLINATGGRLKEFENEKWKHITLIEDKRFKGVQTRELGKLINNNGQYCYIDEYTQEHKLTKKGEFVYHHKLNNVIVISQGDNSLDIQIKKENPIVLTHGNYQEIINFLKKQKIITPNLDEIEKIIKTNFDINLKFEISSFQSGFRFSTRKPLDVHNVDKKRIFKFDIGDSLATVPITLGTNISLTQNMLNTKVLPLINKLHEILINYELCVKAKEERNLKKQKNKNF